MGTIEMKKAIATTEILGQTIRYYRKRQSLTQASLALLAGVGRRFIVELEQGKDTIQFAKVLQVLHALGIGIEVVAHWDDSDSV